MQPSSADRWSVRWCSQIVQPGSAVKWIESALHKAKHSIIARFACEVALRCSTNQNAEVYVVGRRVDGLIGDLLLGSEETQLIEQLAASQSLRDG